MIHVLFSSSAAGTLRQLLRSREIRDRVVDLTEWLDWGPIASGNFRDRAEWLDQSVPSDDPGGWSWITDCASEFQQEVASDADRLIWIAPRSAPEQAGLHWYLDQFGAAGAQMIIADYPLRGARRGGQPMGLGELNVDFMAQLFEDCPRAEWDQSRFPKERWQSLMADDALLRIVENGALRSAPIDHFDKFLLQRCGTEWTKGLRAIGYAMGDIWRAGHSADDVFLLWRLRELVQCGALICDEGSLDYPLRSERMAMVQRAD